MTPAHTAPDYPGCPETVLDAMRRGMLLQPARWGLWDALVGPVGFIVASMAVLVLGMALGLSDGSLILLGLVVPWIPLAGWPLIVTSWRGNGPIDLGLRLRWSDVRWGVLYGFIALGAAGFIAVITSAFVGDFTSAAGDAAQQISESGPVALVVFALCVSLGAPLVEELAFRGLAFAALRKRGLNAAWTVGITAVVFAAFHFEPVRFPMLVATGLALGLARWHTKALGAAIVAHAVNNLPGAVFMLVGWGG